jgi:hypothetical protein
VQSDLSGVSLQPSTVPADQQSGCCLHSIFKDTPVLLWQHTQLPCLLCAGSWSEDKMDGQGTYHYSSGDIYTGGFRQGRKHGSGMYNFKAHACQFLGIWSDGEFVEGKWVRHRQCLRGRGCWACRHACSSCSASIAGPVSYSHGGCVMHVAPGCVRVSTAECPHHAAAERLSRLRHMHRLGFGSRFSEHLLPCKQMLTMCRS